MTVVDKELVDHYVHACKGSQERTLLMALDDGYEFTRVVNAMGDNGVKVAFQCILNGWIERGEITAEGRKHLSNGAEA